MRLLYIMLWAAILAAIVLGVETQVIMMMVWFAIALVGIPLLVLIAGYFIMKSKYKNRFKNKTKWQK